jgi:hypothetical protein
MPKRKLKPPPRRFVVGYNVESAKWCLLDRDSGYITLIGKRDKALDRAALCNAAAARTARARKAVLA